MANKKTSNLGENLVDGLKQAIAHERGQIKLKTTERESVIGQNKPMEMTPQAKRLWGEVPKEARPKILNNVWCGQCGSMSSIGKVKMTVDGGDLILNGICTTCSGQVCRVVEHD